VVTENSTHAESTGVWISREIISQSRARDQLYGRDGNTFLSKNYMEALFAPGRLLNATRYFLISPTTWGMENQVSRAMG
jgi:hypothetical protein